MRINALAVLATASITLSVLCQEKDSCTGKYPMSFITKTRTANTVGKDRLSLAVKWLNVSYDEKKDAGGQYRSLGADDNYDTQTMVFTAKYGWATNHHVALGIPHVWNDFKTSTKEISSEGLSNIYVFEKWKFLEETATRPAMAADLWYYFNTGDSKDKRGSDDDSVKLACQISKAWKGFNLHVNPAYRWNLADGVDVGELNVATYVNVTKSFKLACEYNFTYKENTTEGSTATEEKAIKAKEGQSQDIVPGFLWKPSKTSSIKLGAVINLDSDFTYRDKVGVCLKLFYKF